MMRIYLPLHRSTTPTVPHHSSNRKQKVGSNTFSFMECVLMTSYDIAATSARISVIIILLPQAATSKTPRPNPCNHIRLPSLTRRLNHPRIRALRTYPRTFLLLRHNSLHSIARNRAGHKLAQNHLCGSSLRCQGSGHKRPIIRWRIYGWSNARTQTRRYEHTASEDDGRGCSERGTSFKDNNCGGEKNARGKGWTKYVR
jgi:hypothetical protein